MSSHERGFHNLSDEQIDSINLRPRAPKAPENCGTEWSSRDQTIEPHECNRLADHRGKHHCWCGKERSL